MSTLTIGQRSSSTSNLVGLLNAAAASHGLPSAAACHALPVNGRKPGKVAFLASQPHGHLARERERLGLGVYRVVTSKRVGMFVAALLACISLLMLINVASLVSFHFNSLKEQQMDLAAQLPIGRVVQETKPGERLVQHRIPRKVSMGSAEEQPLGLVSDAETQLDTVTEQPLQESRSTPHGHQDDAAVNNTLHVNSAAPHEVGFQVGVPPAAEGKTGSFDLLMARLEEIKQIYKDPPLSPGHPCQGFALPPPPADKKRTGPRPCPVCYLPVGNAIQQMPEPGVSTSTILQNLTYVLEPTTAVSSRWVSGSDFGGHPTLEQREKSFQIQESMHIHCGFVKGVRPGVGTGFDMDEDDLIDMDRCQGVVVASAIFGNYDQLQQPKNMSKEAVKNICFFMFIDEETHAFLKRESSVEKVKKIGLWRVVVAHNLPYSDARRNGKIPKLLLHRLFPNARFSLWIDGKLELVVDPYQILERFLWRKNTTFAISQHYKRFDVFEEAEANKAAGKYDNASIDAQVDFYWKEGLRPYNRSKLPIISDVPEGCVIIREHTPMTNLFTCLWFNEVDRFTSRDQLSFGIVRDKIMARIPFKLSMFLDCERRNFVVQAYHRDLLEQMKALSIVPEENMDFSSEPNIKPTRNFTPQRVDGTNPQPARHTAIGTPRKGPRRHSRHRRGSSGRQKTWAGRMDS